MWLFRMVHWYNSLTLSRYHDAMIMIMMGGDGGILPWMETEEFRLKFRDLVELMQRLVC